MFGIDRARYQDSLYVNNRAPALTTDNGLFCFTKGIDVTNLNKVIFDFAQYTNGNYRYVIYGLSTIPVKTYAEADKLTDNKYKSTVAYTVKTNKHFEIDVSSLTGIYYPFLGSPSANDIVYWNYLKVE